MSDAEHRFDPDADDWSRTPWTYPGTAAPHSGLLHDGRLLPITSGRTLDARLRAESLPPRDERLLVVAVGSNASPAVMTRKLATAGVSTTLPLLAVRLRELAVGHSGHVSVRGFFPAAPYLCEGAVTDTFASLLDEDQIVALDRTEPNYVRTEVDSALCRIETGDDGGTTFSVYVSRWGALGPPGQPVWPLTGQVALVSALVDQCEGFASLVGEAQPRRVLGALASEPDLRARLQRFLQVAGWSRPSGLEIGQSSG